MGKEGLKKLLRAIELIKKSNVKKEIDGRTAEFKQCPDIFSELCFCILTANYTAEGGIRVQKQIGDGFCTCTEGELAAKLKSLGYRFPNTRAKYIVEARKHLAALGKIAKLKGETARIWLVENVKGLGYKEASHFLRNIGHEDVAIIDFHIIDLLVRYGLIDKPKTRSLSKKRYLEIENTLALVAKKANLTLGKLDLYLWFMETGKVLK